MILYYIILAVIEVYDANIMFYYIRPISGFKFSQSNLKTGLSFVSTWNKA